MPRTKYTAAERRAFREIDQRRDAQERQINADFARKVAELEARTNASLAPLMDLLHRPTTGAH